MWRWGCGGKVGGMVVFVLLGDLVVLVAWGDLTINNKILEMFFVEIQRAIKQNDCLVAFFDVFGCIFLNLKVKLEHNLKDRKNAKPLSHVHL